MKKEIAFRVLEALAETAADVIDLFDVFLTVGYGASLGKFERELRKREYMRDGETDRLKRNYAVLLSKLKAQGLIEAKKVSGQKTFFITRKGKEKLRGMRENKKREFPQMPNIQEKSDAFIIVAFDVPEKQKGKREWLRRILAQMGLTMVQKSVWMGKIKLPEEFFDALRTLDLLECVEIFEISKTGTLKQIT